MISIITLIHNQIEMTRRCLQSICESQVPHDVEVICVDNASSESMASLQEEFTDAPCHFGWLRNDRNLSFSVANNRAARQACGSSLLFLNNDVILDRRSIHNLLLRMEQDSRCGIAGLRLLFPDGGRIQHAGITQMLWGYVSNYGSGAAADDPRLGETRPVFAVTGAVLAIRKDLFERVGGFGEDYKWGYEDVDLCMKARRLGYAVLYVAESPSIHFESATLAQTRQLEDFDANYRRYRSEWDHILVPREQAYLAGLKDQGIKKIALFGTGQAGIGLFRILEREGIRVIAFTNSHVGQNSNTFCERPMIPLTELGRIQFDRLMVGSQFYFEVESLIKDQDPSGAPIYPVVL